MVGRPAVELHGYRVMCPQRRQGRSSPVVARRRPSECRYAADPGRRPHRIAADLRRGRSSTATHRVTLAAGPHDVRVGDVADELDVSTGLIHYHFATKDELIEAMLRDGRARGRRRAGALTGSPPPEDRLARVIDTYLPSSRSDPSWVLWIDVLGRGAARRQPPADLRGARHRVGRAARRGHRRRRRDRGRSAAPTPWPSAWRLCALLDGLGLQVVLHQATMTRAQMHKHVPPAAALELRYELGRGRLRSRPVAGSIGRRPIKPVARRRPLVHPPGWVMGLTPPTEVHAPRRSRVVLAPRELPR